jgi:arginase
MAIHDDGRTGLPIEVICAPWNIGLRPNPDGTQPGTWKAAQTLREAGLIERLEATKITELPRPPYAFEPQPGTRMRNGSTLREHSLLLADAVADSIAGHRLPVVIGGDCSVLLGSLAGARRDQVISLVHVDGHSDFDQLDNQDPSRLGSAAGMDLALATGRGESLLTSWPGIDGPLVTDEHVVQIGDRTGDPLPAGLMAIGIDELLAKGVEAGADRAVEHLGAEHPVWVHVDLDVLDAAVLPAVDSPGTPGLNYAQLAELLSRLIAAGGVLGVDITIYDPDLDPGCAQAPAIVDCIATGLAAQRQPRLTEQ